LAADQGLAVAQRNLGVMYASGTGVSRDAREAARWYADVFRDRYYLEVQAHDSEGQAKHNSAILALGDDLDGGRRVRVRYVWTRQGADAARHAALTTLAAIKYALGDLERVQQVVHMLDFVNSAPGFSDQPRVIHGAADRFLEIFGERGKPTRAAIGGQGSGGKAVANLGRRLPHLPEMPLGEASMRSLLRLHQAQVDRQPTFRWLRCAGWSGPIGWCLSIRTPPLHWRVRAWRMIRRRAVAAGIQAPIGNHSFRATGITAYLANDGTLEHAQEMAGHESPRTTKLYDRTKDRLTQKEVERIRL